MRFLKSYQHLPQEVYTLFLAQIINRSGDFMLAVLPFLLVQHYHLPYHRVGFCAMLVWLSSMPGALLGGKLGDKWGRKRTYLLFQSLAAFCMLGCLVFKTQSAFIALVCLSQFANGAVRPALSAIIIDVLPPEKRSQGFTLAYLGVNIGSSVGALLVGFLYTHHFNLLFILDALTSLMAVGLMAWRIRETLPQQDATAPVQEQTEAGSTWSVLLRRPTLLAFFFICILFAFVYNQSHFGLSLTLTEIFREKGPKYVGFVNTCNCVCVVLLTLPLNKYTQSWRLLNNLILSGLFLAMGFGMIYFIRAFGLFFLSTFIWTMGEILYLTYYNVYIANQAPQNFRARLNGVISFIWAMGSVLSTYGLGKYMSRFGVHAIWPLVFGAAMLGTVVMVFLRQREKRMEQSTTNAASSAPRAYEPLQTQEAAEG